MPDDAKLAVCPFVLAAVASADAALPEGRWTEAITRVAAESRALCLGEDCALWNGKYGKCSIAVIADQLSASSPD